MAGKACPAQLLVVEHRAGLDGVRHPAATGVLQLYHSVNDGYFEARSLGYITQPGNVLLEWMRMPGDIVFIGGGILPLLWIAWVAIKSFWQGRNTAYVDELPDEPLYTELPAAAGARNVGDTTP